MSRLNLILPDTYGGGSLSYSSGVGAGRWGWRKDLAEEERLDPVSPLPPPLPGKQWLLGSPKNAGETDIQIALVWGYMDPALVEGRGSGGA